MSSNENALPLDQLLAQAGWMRRMARGLLGEGGPAEDAVQDTLLTALERPPRLRGNVRGWFGTVLLNKIRGEARRHKRGVTAVPDAAATDAPSPEETVGNLQLQRQLATLLLELEPAVRQVVYLRYVEELDSPQIGRRLGQPAGTVRWRLKLGIEQLRRGLDAQDVKEGSKPGRWRRALMPLVPAAWTERAPAASLPRLGPVPWIGALGMFAVVGAGGYAAFTARSRPRPLDPPATSSAEALLDTGGSNRPDRRPPALVAAAAPDGLPSAGRPADPAAASSPPSRQPAARRTAPFSAVVWSGEQLRVRIGDDLVELLAIDGRPMAEIIAHAKQTFPDPPTLWQKRIVEDLVEVLAGMGPTATDPLPLHVRRPGGAPETIEAPMTLENRAELIRTKLTTLPPASPVARFARVSPFTGLVFQGDAMDVEVGGAWYRLVSIDGVGADQLVAMARKTWGHRWQKRLAEDPVEVLTAALGRSPSGAVDLVLEQRGSRQRVEKRQVPMTEENRKRVKATWR